MSAQLQEVIPFIFKCEKSSDLQGLSLPGTGAFKLGVNYAPGVLPQKAAAKLGYAQNLWLHGPEHHLTEVSHPHSD
jgi:branched-subunit amino acid aminotransferase/4-amino-4-deoxychorismate lyase